MSIIIRIRGDASGFDRTMAHVNRGIGGMKTMIAGLAVALTAGFIGQKILGFGKSASMAASDFEQLTMQFETLTKSADKTASLLAQIREEAMKSPLSVSDYAQAAQKLLQTGRAAEEIMPILKMIGDISMGNADRFGRLALAYSQVIDRNQLLGTELNQLSEAGFGALGVMSERTGETMGELRKRMETTGISAAELTQAFVDATSETGRFYQAIQKGADTTAGKIAKASDAVLSLKIAFGTGLNEGVRAGAEAFAAGISGMEEQAGRLGGVLGNAIKQSFEGRHEEMMMIGVSIGKVIAAGVEVGMKGAWVQLGENALKGFETIHDWIVPMTPEERAAPKASAGVAAKKGEYMQSLIEDALISMRDASNRLTEPVGVTPAAQRLFDQGVRSGDPGYGGTEMSKMLQTLERIARAVDKPFPN